MTRLEWIPTPESRLFDAVGYDGSRGRIGIRLMSGSEHWYEGCSQSDWRNLLASESKGRYVFSVLSSRQVPSGPPRPNRYRLLANAFLPAQSVVNPSDFAGRLDQVKEAALALHMGGTIPLIFGDRGLGKSSLAIQMQRVAMGDVTLLDRLGLGHMALGGDERFLVVTVSCATGVSDLDDLIQKMVNALENVEADDGQSRFALVDRQTRIKATLKLFELEQTKSYEAKKQDATYTSLNLVERFLEICAAASDTFQLRILVIVDEFDRITDKGGIAAFLKEVSSDFLKIALVGIARDWGDLLADHESVMRQVKPIVVPRMGTDELDEIIANAEVKLLEGGVPMSFALGARERLIGLSAGLPWFVHVIGQASLLRASEESLAMVDEATVVEAARGLARDQYATVFSNLYSVAVRGSRLRELVLRGLASHPDVNIRTADTYPRLVALGVTNPAVYVGHLMQDNYGAILERPRKHDRGLVTFRDPMFRQYVNVVSFPSEALPSPEDV